MPMMAFSQDVDLEGNWKSLEDVIFEIKMHPIGEGFVLTNLHKGEKAKCDRIGVNHYRSEFKDENGQIYAIGIIKVLKPELIEFKITSETKANKTYYLKKLNQLEVGLLSPEEIKAELQKIDELIPALQEKLNRVRLKLSKYNFDDPIYVLYETEYSKFSNKLIKLNERRLVLSEQVNNLK